jgi:hypothetical protein
MKTIKSIIAKLEEKEENVLGRYFFISVRGGSTNTNLCGNAGTCTGVNTGGVLTGCVNQTQCAGTTNDSHCTNHGTCPQK